MNPSPKPSLLPFFGLVFALSIPFWAAGALINAQLLPALPISALGLITPLAAAAILVYREQGGVGVSALLKRSFDFKRIRSKIWLLPVVLIEPAVMVLSFIVIRLTGVAIPLPQFSLGSALALFTVFFLGALGEELGWSGYVTDPLQERYGALAASLILGAVWAAWHFIPLLEVPRSAGFIAWWSLGTLTSRVIIVWLYNHTGRSVFVAAVFHAMINLTWQLFPVNGSFYDPRVTSLIVAAVAVIVVIAGWPRRLPQQAPA